MLYEEKTELYGSYLPGPRPAVELHLELFFYACQTSCNDSQDLVLQNTRKTEKERVTILGGRWVWALNCHTLILSGLPLPQSNVRNYTAAPTSIQWQRGPEWHVCGTGWQSQQLHYPLHYSTGLTARWTQDKNWVHFLCHLVIITLEMIT